MIQMLLGQPLEKADLSELTAISSGAAPLPDEVRREFEARVPSATIYEGYGCTEAATLISANPAGARVFGTTSAAALAEKTFGPGKHTLTTDNIPILTRLSWPKTLVVPGRI